MLVSVIGESIGTWMKAANSTIADALDGHPATPKSCTESPPRPRTIIGAVVLAMDLGPDEPLWLVDPIDGEVDRPVGRFRPGRDVEHSKPAPARSRVKIRGGLRQTGCGSLARKLLWFVGLWAAGVVAVALPGLAIRAVLA